MNVYLPYTARLPNTYQEVEYIQTTGTQFIDTGLFSSSSIQTETKIELTTTSQNLPVFGGCYQGDAPYMNTYYHLTCYSSKWYYGINGPGTEGNAGTYNPTIGTQYTIIYNGTNNGLYINGTNIATITGTTGYPGSTLSISARGGTGNQNPKRYGQYKFFYFRMYNKSTGKYERDFVPCYRKSDSVIGLYDLVNNQFYTNSGTGTFSKGNDVTMAVLKNAYIGEVYEYSYDFRGKTKTQVTNDGWSAGTGDSGTSCGSNGLYQTSNQSGGRLIRQFNVDMSNAKKITMSAQIYASNTSSWGCTWSIATSFARANTTAIYIGNDAKNMQVAGTATTINPTLSGNTYKREYVIDLENKTATVTFLTGSTYTNTISITDSQINTIRNNNIYGPILAGNYGYLQTVSIIIE